MKNKERRRARLNKGDKYSELRAANVGLLPAGTESRTLDKYADPEDVLQTSVNNVLKVSNQFQFRIPASVYAAAGDKSIAGWPDSPMITRLASGLFLGGPLELKRKGETLNPSQRDMQPLIGTVKADTWEASWAFIKWYWEMVEKFKAFVRDNPPPPLPKGVEG